MYVKGVSSEISSGNKNLLLKTGSKLILVIKWQKTDELYTTVW